jgi:Sodium/hydrogen exchanger family
MPDVSFSSLTVVLGVAFAAPLALGLVPRLRIPAVVLEIVLGIVVGPQVLGWAKVDQPVQILALVGLAFLLFLAGLEIDFNQLRGRLLRVAAVGFGATLVLALLVGLALETAGLVRDSLLGGVILTAISLGLVIPVLKERSHRLAARPASDRRRLDRRLLRGGAALAVVLSRYERHDDEVGPARGVRCRGGARHRGVDPPRPIHATQPRPDPASGHDGADPGSRRHAPVAAPGRARPEPRARDHPRRLRRRSDRQCHRPEHSADPPAVQGEARSHRLRLPGPGPSSSRAGCVSTSTPCSTIRPPCCAYRCSWSHY